MTSAQRGITSQGDFGAAATLLHSLMWSRLAPKYFWVTLLIDALPFISLGGDDAVLLGSEQTHEIMHCLQVSVKLKRDPQEHSEDFIATMG